MVERTSGIGGTDISAILGMNPWRTPFDVYLEKTRRLEQDYIVVDPRKRWGQRLQRVIADAYSEETGRAVEWVDQTRSHPSRVFQIYTPDALCLNELRGVDVKTAGLDQSSKWGDSGTSDVPDYVALQCAWYMSASERNLWDVALLVAGSDFRVFTLTRDMELERALLETGEKFWRDHVLADTPPDITASATTDAWIKKRFPKNDGSIRQATEQEHALLNEYAEAYTKFKASEKLHDDLAARVKVAIGDSDGLEWGGGKITYKLCAESFRPATTIRAHRRIHTSLK